MSTSFLKPGLLVALKSTVTGGVHYSRRDISNTETTAQWETTRVLDDPAEHERATKARGLALAAIKSVCTLTSFGLLCPESYETELDQACAKARQIRDAFNAESRYTRVDVFVLKGRIAASDEQAIRAIGQEVTSLLDDMSKGITDLDPAQIREAATRARNIAAMLAPEQASKISEAVSQARAVARAIVKRIEKKGEDSASVLADFQTSAIRTARFAFLDTSEIQVGDADPVQNVQRFADLDASLARETPECSPDPEPDQDNPEPRQASNGYARRALEL